MILVFSTRDQNIHEIEGHFASVTALCIDRGNVYSGGDGEVLIWGLLE